MLDGARGQYDEAAVAAAIRPDSRYMPKSCLLWVEQTGNLGGGSIWPLVRIAAVTDVARRHGLHPQRWRRILAARWSTPRAVMATRGAQR
jgi:threonine aldolase